MPWKETCAVKERIRFIDEWERGDLSMVALCRKYGVSRQTGYKWVHRYQEFGGCAHALTDLSRTPHHHPWATDQGLVDLVIRARKRWPNWGPVTLHQWLKRVHPHVPIPAPSTIGRIVKRHGLSKARHRRRRTPPCEQPFSKCVGPNQVVCADFKGHFRLGDGTVCYPLTIMDAHTRLLMRCEALTSTAVDQARPVFQSAFRQYGLPAAIRTDNGPPFASRAAGGLSELSVWWLKLGICQERIEPGKPQQNGRHERMHRTLKQATACPPRASFRAQQRAFDAFRMEYNEQRPHRALQGRCPADLYVASQTPLPDTKPVMEYPFGEDVVYLDKLGMARWGRRRIYVSKTLRHEPVLFERIGQKTWEVYFGRVLLGLADYSKPGNKLIEPRRTWKKVSTM